MRKGNLSHLFESKTTSDKCEIRVWFLQKRAMRSALQAPFLTTWSRVLIVRRSTLGPSCYEPQSSAWDLPEQAADPFADWYTHRVRKCSAIQDAKSTQSLICTGRIASKTQKLLTQNVQQSTWPPGPGPHDPRALIWTKKCTKTRTEYDGKIFHSMGVCLFCAGCVVQPGGYFIENRSW